LLSDVPCISSSVCVCVCVCAVLGRPAPRASACRPSAARLMLIDVGPAEETAALRAAAAGDQVDTTARVPRRFVWTHAVSPAVCCVATSSRVMCSSSTALSTAELHYLSEKKPSNPKGLRGKKISISPADGNSTAAYRRCSHLANACEAATATASVLFRPFPVAVR